MNQVLIKNTFLGKYLDESTTLHESGKSRTRLNTTEKTRGKSQGIDSGLPRVRNQKTKPFKLKLAEKALKTEFCPGILRYFTYNWWNDLQSHWLCAK
jgi:hypothetical protein